LHRAVFENVILPRMIQRRDVRVYFDPSGTLPVWRLPHVKMVTMFQNMLVFARKERQRYPFGFLRFRLAFLRLLQARSFQNADLLIFLSHYAQEVIDTILPHRRGQSVIIPHGLDDAFRYQEDRILPVRIADEYVLYVSILDMYKAQLEVIQAWHLLRRQRHTQEKLVLVGPAYPYYAKKVKALIHKLGLEHEVILLGRVPYEELPAYYQHARINLFASSCENCPNILLEALAAGQPVLCSNYPPMPEFAGNAVEYFNPYVPEELTTLLLTCLDNATLRKDLGAKALHQAQEFQWQETANSTWNVLFSLTNSGLS
jgi:glycosyltransferase involved in cell wall biosynthesis